MEQILSADESRCNDGRRKLLIQDLEPHLAERLLADCTEEKGWKVISDDGTIRPCIGCFGCWLKTPGICVIQDGYNKMGVLMAQSDEMVLVTRCCYGGTSPFIKRVLDRSIPYIHPDFVTKNGEMHHRYRYDKVLDLTVIFYGEDLTQEEMKTAKEWVDAAADNFYCNVKQVLFYKKPEELEGMI